MAEPIAELNPLDDLGQSILAVEFAPFLPRRHHQLERHGQTGLAADAPLGAFCAMPDRHEGAFDRVCNRYADPGGNVRLCFLDQGVCCEQPGQRHRKHEGAGRPIHTMSCELVLVAGRLCDAPGRAESANP